MALAALVHLEDPAAAIWRELRDHKVNLDDFDIAAQGVLIAVYTRPDDVQTAGGILLPHAVVKEDEYQSKEGLVIKLGRRAFVDDEHVTWHDFRCDVGSWVVFRASDGMKLMIGGLPCRLMSDVYLKMKVQHADAVG
jgi:co-chaperonin GroES (HSP10)